MPAPLCAVQVGGVSTVELNRLELEMLQLLEFRLSVTPEQLVGILLDAQSGRLVAQMAAAYSSACGMATAMDTAILAMPLQGVNTADAAASSNVAGSVLCGAGQGAAACWEATSPAGACGLAVAAAAAAAAHGAQQMAALLQQQQQQQLMQQLAVVHRKRRSSVDMLDGSDFRPRAYHRASMEVVAMAQ